MTPGSPTIDGKTLPRGIHPPSENKIHLGDCTSFLRSLPDLSVDFTFYDPPYNVKKDYGEHKDDMSPEQYREWMIEIISHARRLSRRGFGVYVGSELTRLFFELIPDAHLIPVHKRAVGVMKGNYFLQYHSLFVVGTPLKKVKDLWDDIRLPGEGYFFKEERFGDHPGQTAKALVKKVLLNWTAPGEILLDPFLGVGTSAIAALELGRYIWGAELSPKYHKIMLDRIKKFKSQASFMEIVPEAKPEQGSLL